MRRIPGLFLVVAVCATLCSCSGTPSPVAPPPESAASAPVENRQEQTFPFEDDEGRTRYRLVINGDEVETKNLPFTHPDAPKAGYYPLKEVLSYLGVESLSSQDSTILTTRVNGKTLTVRAGVAKMTYGPKSVESKTSVPVCIDGCLYVPGFLFMSIFDDAIVDFSDDRKAATLDTSTSIDLAASGTSGLSIPTVGSPGGSSGTSGSGGASVGPTCGTCGGSGRSVCTFCAGTGTKVEYRQAYDPISRQMKTTQKTASCPRCGGSGRVTCPVCGGSGHR